MTFLGETPIEAKDTEFKDYTPVDWALYYIQCYGGIDGAHHKDWVLDQVVRVLKGTPVLLKKAEWDNHEPEIRFTTGEPTQEYHDWVDMVCGPYDEEEEEYEYEYDEGIAP